MDLLEEKMGVLIESALENLANGVRGKVNVVENLLINTLSRYLFDNEIFENAVITITDITENGIEI